VCVEIVLRCGGNVRYDFCPVEFAPVFGHNVPLLLRKFILKFNQVGAAVVFQFGARSGQNGSGKRDFYTFPFGRSGNRAPGKTGYLGKNIGCGRAEKPDIGSDAFFRREYGCCGSRLALQQGAGGSGFAPLHFSVSYVRVSEHRL
jgi:hypothetical protein